MIKNVANTTLVGKSGGIGSIFAIQTEIQLKVHKISHK